MNRPPDIESRVAGFAKEHGMGLHGRMIAGLSGGPDSVCMLRILLNLGAEPVCVHVNHLIRGAEADADEEFCRRLCEKLCVPLVIYKKNAPALSAERGIGLEEAAREVRWESFYDAAKQYGAAVIAVAHNANDRAETFLFNAARGSGTKGLGSILPRREKDGFEIIRPVLCLTRDEILGYLSDLGQDYATDSTNSDTDYTRNYIRSEILPRFGRVNASYITNINACADAASEADGFIEECAKSFLSSKRTDAEGLLSLHPCVFARVISIMFAEAGGDGLTKAHINIIRGFIKTAQNGRRLNLPSGTDLILDGGSFRFTGRDAAAEFCTPLSSGKNSFPDFGLDIYVEPAKTALSADEYKNIYKLVKRFKINSDIIRGDLYVRSRAPSDSIVYGAMTHTVKKILSEKKVPSSLRRTYPLICDGFGVLAVPPFVCRDGCRGDEGVYITCCVRRV